MADPEYLADVKPMPPEATAGGIDGADLGNYSDAEIEAALNGTPLPDTPSAPAAEVEADAPVALVVPETEADGTPKPLTAAETTETAVAADPEALAPQLEQAKRDAATALELERQRAHSSRLAAEIGNLNKQLKALRDRPGPEADGDPDGAVYDSRIAAVEAQLTPLLEQTRKNAVIAAINAESQGMPKDDAFGKLTPEEQQQILAPYADDWQAALDSQDEAQARRMGRGILLNLVADARLLQNEKERAQARQMVGDGKADLRQRKLAEGATARRAAAPSATRPAPAKTLDQMTDKEVEDLTDRALAGAS